MGRGPKEAGCAEGGIEERAAYVAAKLVFFNECKTVASGPGAWSSSERKVIEAVEDYQERCADIKMNHGGCRSA